MQAQGAIQIEHWFLARGWPADVVDHDGSYLAIINVPRRDAFTIYDEIKRKTQLVPEVFGDAWYCGEWDDSSATVIVDDIRPFPPDDEED